MDCFVESKLTFIDVAKKLMLIGYTVDKLDTVLNYMTTLPRGIQGINGEYYLNIMKIDQQYKIVGMYRFNFTASLAGLSSAKGAYEMARYHKSQGNTESRVFNEVLEASGQLGKIITLMK